MIIEKKLYLVKKGHHLSGALARAYERYNEAKMNYEKSKSPIFKRSYQAKMDSELIRIRSYEKRIEANEPYING